MTNDDDGGGGDDGSGGGRPEKKGRTLARLAARTVAEMAIASLAGHARGSARRQGVSGAATLPRGRRGCAAGNGGEEETEDQRGRRSVIDDEASSALVIRTTRSAEAPAGALLQVVAIHRASACAGVAVVGPRRTRRARGKPRPRFRVPKTTRWAL